MIGAARAGAGLESIPRLFWKRVAGAESRLLMLDYDGTLAPFRVERLEAIPLAGSIDLLRSIASSTATTVAIVSGRPVVELESLVAPLEVVLVGEHGWEERGRRGKTVRHPLPPKTEQGLRAAAAAVIEAGLGEHLERKRTSLMIHTRGLTSARAAAARDACERLWAPIADSSELALVPVNGGSELRAKGRDKGTAVRGLLESAPPGALPVYLGDDETDEDAFREIRERGFGFRVGEDDRATLAWRRLRSWRDVPGFLRRWSSTVEGVDPVLRGEA